MNGNRGQEVLAVAVLFLILSYLTIGLRIYARVVLMKTWGHDDSCMVATLMLFTMYTSFLIYGAVHGVGRHRWEITDEEARSVLLLWYFYELFYVAANCVLKCAIGFFLLRVAIKRWHIVAIKVLMAGTIIFGIAYFIMVVFQCLPISEFWNTHPASRKCFTRGTTLGVTYAISACNAAADWAFGLLPFCIVWGLDMRMRTKLLVAGILAFAAIGSTATVVRMKYIHVLMNGPDFLYSIVDIAIWNTLEIGIGVVAGNIATLRPVIRRCLWRLGLASDPNGRQSRAYRPSSSDTRRKNRRRYRRSLSPSDLVPTEVNGISTKISSPGCTTYQDMIIAPKIISTGVTEEADIPDGQIKAAAYQRGIPSPALLIDRFRRVAAEVRKAALLPEDAGVASHIASLAMSKVLFKKSGLAVGGDVEAVLARTEILLEEGDLDAAAREMNGLQGWAKVLSKDWLSECRRVLEVRQALDVIATEARLNSLLID